MEEAIAGGCEWMFDLKPVVTTLSLCVLWKGHNFKQYFEKSQQKALEK